MQSHQTVMDSLFATAKMGSLTAHQVLSHKIQSPLWLLYYCTVVLKELGCHFSQTLFFFSL